MATLRDGDDFERCLIEILAARGGRATRGTVVREFDRRHRSSIPRDLREGDPPRWERLLDSARERLVRRGVVFGDPELWELP
ncbi:MAG TPA: hypothetical protein VGL23_01635 [Chloroflexota bacterium]